MSRIVRTSKFRHVFGTPSKKDDCFDNVPICRSSWDSNFCDVNQCFIACILEVSGGGAFAVLTHEQCGKISEVPKITGHKGPVLDIAFNPFNSHMIASGSDDTTVKIWVIPEGGLKSNMSEAALTLEGHGRKVGQVNWHPTAANLLFTSSADLTIKMWDVSTGREINTISCHPDALFWFSFNFDGSKMVTTCKDKKVRLIDPRSGEVLATADGNQGAKPARCLFLGESNRVITTGFSKMHERQFMILDGHDLTLLKSEVLDTSSGTLMPFYDSDLHILYLGGKGDGNIRYFEIDDTAPYCHFLSQYTSSDPQRGFGFMPKRALDINKCEIARIYKLHPKCLIEPISFIVPRKSDNFHDDLFPDTQGDKPSLTADEWIAGKNANPLLISLKDGFVPSRVEFNAPVIESKKEQEALPLNSKV